MKQGMDKDLNIFLSLPGQAASLTLQNNLRIILGSKPKNFKNIEARQKVRYYCKKCVCCCF